MDCTFSPSDWAHDVQRVVQMERGAEVGNSEVLESPMGEEGGSRDHSGPTENHGHVEGGDEDADEGDESVDCRPGMRN